MDVCECIVCVCVCVCVCVYVYEYNLKRRKNMHLLENLRTPPDDILLTQTLTHTHTHIRTYQPTFTHIILETLKNISAFTPQLEYV